MLRKFRVQLVNFKLNAEKPKAKSNTESGRARERQIENERERHTHTHSQVFALGLTDKRINAIKFFFHVFHFILRFPPAAAAAAICK